MFYHPAMRATYREEPCRAALNRVTGMGFRWSLNPYTGCAHRCAFCYVRGFERRADRPSDDRYGTSLRVKVNIIEQLRRELARPSWRQETVVIGAATDPYQPAEGRYRLTRGCIAALGASRTPISIITRGPLVVRDIDVLTDAAHTAPVEIAVSVATLDESTSARLEPGVAPPRQRLRTIRLLTDAGLRAGLALAPVMPGLTDAPASLAALMRAARDAGATHVWWNLLNLRPGTREHFLGVLGREWPDALAEYERRYPPGGGGYLAAGVVEPIERRLTAVRAGSGIRDRRGRPIEPETPPEQLHMAI
jgi:DNA repair photolyase